MNPVPLAPQYAARFRQNIVRSVQATLDSIPDGESLLPENIKARALKVLDHALEVDEAWTSARELLLVMAPKMEQAGHRGDWISYLKEGIGFCLQKNDKKEEAVLRFHLGYLYLLMSRFDSANAEFKISGCLFQKFSDNQGQGRVLNHLAIIALRKGMYAEAKEFAQSGLQKLSQDEFDCADSFYVLGWSNYESSQIETALPFLEKSLEIWSKSGNKRKIAWGLSNLGPVLRALGQTAKAKSYYEQSLKLTAELKDLLSYAKTLTNLGVLESENGKYAEAITLFEEALLIYKQVSDRQGVAKSYTNLGIEHRNTKNYVKSEQALQVSIEMWEEFSIERSVCNAMFELWLTYTKAENHPKGSKTIESLLERLNAWLDKQEETTFARKILQDIEEVRNNPNA